MNDEVRFTQIEAIHAGQNRLVIGLDHEGKLWQARHDGGDKWTDWSEVNMKKKAKDES